VGSLCVGGIARHRHLGDVAGWSEVPTRHSVSSSGCRPKILLVRKLSLCQELPGWPSVPQARGGGAEQRPQPGAARNSLPTTWRWHRGWFSVIGTPHPPHRWSVSVMCLEVWPLRPCSSWPRQRRGAAALCARLTWPGFPPTLIHVESSWLAWLLR
jgi:hypothetical protein